jgi:flagellar protein FliS
MQANKAAREYGQVSIESAVTDADAHSLIALLFSQLDKELMAAKYYVQQQDHGNFRSKVIKANRILAGLQGSLDFEQGGELAANLSNLYAFCVRKLTKALATPDHEAVSEVSVILKPIMTAWDEIAADKSAA